MRGSLTQAVAIIGFQIVGALAVSAQESHQCIELQHGKCEEARRMAAVR